MAETLSDEIGVIRYDWSQLKLLYVSGVGCTDLAKSLTKDCPEEFNRVRGAISMQCHREEWEKIRESGRAIISQQPSTTKNNGSTQLQNVATDLAASVFAHRKNSYLDKTTLKVDQAAEILAKQPLNDMEDVHLAFKQFEPVHRMAVDLHGLNAKDSPAALNVSFLGNPEQCKVVVDVDVETSN